MELQFHKIAPSKTYNIHVLVDELTSSNCYIIEKDNYAIIIDPNNGPKIKSFLELKNLTPEVILLTHEHCDHMQGLEYLREVYDVKLITNIECSYGIQNTRQNMSRIMETYLYFKNKQEKITPYKPFSCKESDITFKDSFDFEFHNLSLKIVSCPGHTSGSECITLNNEAFFSGDYLIKDEPVITRLPSGNLSDYNLKTKPYLKGLPIGLKIYPGHGCSFIFSKEVMEEHELY